MFAPSVCIGVWHIIECITRLRRDIHSYIIRFDEHISPKRVYHQPFGLYIIRRSRYIIAALRAVHIIRFDEHISPKRAYHQPFGLYIITLRVYIIRQSRYIIRFDEHISPKRVYHTRARSPFARWHSVLRSVFDGTLAEQSARGSLVQARTHSHLIISPLDCMT